MAALSKGRVADVYSNILNLQLVTSAANALTFQEIDVGLTIFEKVALLISRVDFFMTQATLRELAANTDTITIAITQSNQLANLDILQNGVIDEIILCPVASGTPANSELIKMPYTINYQDLGGGGVLVAPRPLYLAAISGGFAAAATVNMRFYFRIIRLKPEEYFELLESRRFFG